MYNLLHGDCLELMVGIPDASVDMILADLPYGTTECAWDSVIPFDLLWAHYRRVIKKNGAIVLTSAQPFTAALGASNIKHLKYSWVWKKSRPTGHLNAKKRPLGGFEDILVFSYGAAPYHPQELIPCTRTIKNSASHLRRGKGNKTSTVSGGLKDEPYIQEFTGYPTGILEFASEGVRVHPTQKPVALMEYLIKTYTLLGQTVLDNTMGSGTTGVAALRTGRRFIGIEKNDEYFEIATRRITSVPLPPWLVK